MNQLVRPKIGASACPHDCPSTCALEVEILDGRTIGRVRGAEENAYTAGVICAKVARYAERVHHPDRLKHPLRRVGAKGSGEFAPISWDDALDLVAEQFQRAEQKHGSEAVWPYYYAGTMGYRACATASTACAMPRNIPASSPPSASISAWTGFIAGTGKLAGADPREMAKSDLVTIWGTNAVNTQVNVMTHATRARKERGAKIVVVDIYMNSTMQQADLAVLIRPGTDGALACAVMHCLFRDGKADWDYLDRYTDAPRELEAHVRTRDPDWAAKITGCPAETIEEFARLVGERKRAYFRLGYGFSRSRNGATNMHAASCIAAVTGAWQLEGGGAFHNNGDVFHSQQEPDRRLGPARPVDPHARPVAHRRHPDRRRGRAARRRPGDGDAHPEHQSGFGRARSGSGQARLCPRRSVRLRARAVHDRHRESRRRGAARHHVRRARRLLSRPAAANTFCSGRS